MVPTPTLPLDLLSLVVQGDLAAVFANDLSDRRATVVFLIVRALVGGSSIPATTATEGDPSKESERGSHDCGRG